MLRFEKLSKSYGNRKVFDHFSHHFGPGLFAVQGPNGIGKSTLLALLSGAEPMDTGEVWVEGKSLRHDALAAKQRLSYVPDECPVYPFVSGRHYLEFIGASKKTRLDRHLLGLVEEFGLSPYLDTRFDAMSLGTQKKLMLSAAWIGDPAVILIDEPTNGLDAQARDVLIRLFGEKQLSGTVLFSTHDADFVAATGSSIIPLVD